MISIITGAVIAGIALGPTVPAVDPADALAAIQERAERALETRQDALDRALERATDNDHLTDAHRTVIVAKLEDAREGLDQVAVEIESADSIAEARAGLARMITEYRVLAVVVPQSAYATGADRLTETAIPRLEEAYDALAERADDDAEALAALERMRIALDEAIELSDGLSDEALAVTPADFNADSTVLMEIREELRDAGQAVREAAEAGRDVAGELRS